MHIAHRLHSLAPNVGLWRESCSYSNDWERDSGQEQRNTNYAFGTNFYKLVYDMLGCLASRSLSLTLSPALSPSLPITLAISYFRTNHRSYWDSVPVKCTHTGQTKIDCAFCCCWCCCSRENPVTVINRIPFDVPQLVCFDIKNILNKSNFAILTREIDEVSILVVVVVVVQSIYRQWHLTVTSADLSNVIKFKMHTESTIIRASF